jgi:tRNA pseudouridine55 synthase
VCDVHGWLVVDKPVGPGSTEIVSAVKRALRQGGYPKVRVGHGGTLDPLASGVLPIALGEATKLAGRMLDADKIYDFTIAFGAETNTLDGEGQVVATSERRPSDAELEAVLPRFTGEIEQLPPAYSALKIEGKPAYVRARAGEAVEMKPRMVTVYSLSSSPSRGGNFVHHPHRPRLERHLHPLARTRHCPCTEHRRPCHHATADQGRSVHPRIRDFAGQVDRTRYGARS